MCFLQVALTIADVTKTLCTKPARKEPTGSTSFENAYKFSPARPDQRTPLRNMGVAGTKRCILRVSLIALKYSDDGIDHAQVFR
jgi:hypothetical protein